MISVNKLYADSTVMSSFTFYQKLSLYTKRKQINIEKNYSKVPTSARLL